MKLPEKTAFTLAEIAAQFEGDEETIIECWRACLISFCIRWKHPEVTAHWYEHTEDGVSRRVKRDCIPYDELLRVPRAEVEAILAEGQSRSLNAYGFEALAVQDHENQKADPLVEVDGYMGPVSLHFDIAELVITRNELLISREERDRFRAILDSDCPPPVKRLELQKQAILETAKALGYDPMAIPWGGKQTIKRRCLNDHPDLLTSDVFEKIWQKTDIQILGYPKGRKR